MAYKVFISYSTKDFPIVKQIRKLLQKPSIEVFIAEYSIIPGQSLSKEIISAIKFCNLFILLWSRNSRESEWVPQEIGIATSEQKIIFPIILEPGINLPGFIQHLKYLNAYQNPDEALSKLRTIVFDQAQKKEQTEEAWVLFGIGAAVLFLLAKK